MNFSGNETILGSKWREVRCTGQCYRERIHFGELLDEAGKGSFSDGSDKICSEDKNDCEKNSIGMSMSSYADAGKRNVTSLSPISVECYFTSYYLTNIQITQMRGSRWLSMTLKCEHESKDDKNPSFLIENPGKTFQNVIMILVSS